MKAAYRLLDLERLSSINKTVLDPDEVEIETDIITDFDLEFYRVVGGTVSRKSDVEIGAIVTARQQAAAAAETAKQQALADALTGWRDDLNAIEVKVDALSQPYRGIFKDILARIRKNTRVLSWMFKNSDN